VALDIFKEAGVPLEKQQFDWHDLVREPISKLDDDAFTRVRVILMNGIENEAWIFQHGFARVNESLRLPLARIRRAEQHQQTLINWLLPADQSVLETTIAYEQVAVEVTAAMAQNEADLYVKQVLDFGLLEDFDHLYRYSALLDRLEGKDANNILQSYTDVRPGRPTKEEHRDPFDDLREHYDHRTAAPITKLNALTITAAEQQTRNYYATVGNVYADPVARQLYAEISSIEEQHVTQYESLLDPRETWLEKWLLHEAMEVYNYFGCMQQETNSRIKAVWERFVQYELAHLHVVMDLFRRIEHRDPAEVLPASLPETISFKSQRDYVRRVLETQVDLRPVGSQFVDRTQVPADSPSKVYRDRLNQSGSPSELVSAGYRYIPGTELLQRARALRGPNGPRGRVQA
jgi:hypothetical protein